MQFETQKYFDFSDVLIKPKRSTLGSRKDVDLIRVLKMKHTNNTITCIPIVAANMDTVATFDLAIEFERLGLMTALHKHYSAEQYIHFFKTHKPKLTWYTLGIMEHDIEKLNQVYETLLVNNYTLDKICIDVPNMYSERCVDFVKRIREKYPNSCIMAGNVATPEQTEQLILSGADITKAGIGQGALCLTREKTGIGVPQLSCIIECSDAAHGLNGHLCGDGGITCPGDLSKAYGGGADLVMMGSVFAGHTENSVFDENGTILIYGMSSAIANNKYTGGLKDYRSSEGREVKINYKGDVKDTVQEYLGGLRSMMTYIGAKQIKNIPKCTTFIPVNNQLNRDLVEKQTAKKLSEMHNMIEQQNKKIDHLIKLIEHITVTDKPTLN